jgi:hypothetical protein
MDTYPAGNPPEDTPKKSNAWLIVFIVLIVISCLCSLMALGCGATYFLLQSNPLPDLNQILPMEESSAPQEKSTAPIEPQSSATNEPLVEIPNLFGPELGDELRLEYCGFSFKPIVEYEKTDWGCIQTMSVPGAGESGPSVDLVGGPTEETVSDDFWTTSLKDMEGLTSMNESKIKVDGKTGVSYELQGTLDGVAVKSRFVGVTINPNQIFSIYAVAPIDRWDEVNTYFEAVMKSVKFFTPVPRPTDTPEPP